jgi:hypothetical protein
MIHAFRIKCRCYIETNFKKNWVGNRDHTVPMETPQSMLEEPSNGSKTTQYLNHKKRKFISTNQIQKSKLNFSLKGFKLRTSCRDMILDNLKIIIIDAYCNSINLDYNST